MKCAQENCSNEFENKTGRKMFCSNACKMKHFRKHGKKGEIKQFQLQAIYNQILEAVTLLNLKNNQPPVVAAVAFQKPKQTQIIRTAEQWVLLKRDCESPEEWAKLKEQIENAPNLTSKQKQLIFNT